MCTTPQRCAVVFILKSYKVVRVGGRALVKK